jgi:hypothetical protein
MIFLTGQFQKSGQRFSTQIKSGKNFFEKAFKRNYRIRRITVYKSSQRFSTQIKSGKNF